MAITPLEQCLDALPRRYPGPGGAVAIVKDGIVAARHSWGFANAETRQAFTPHTRFRMCSITKQFTCMLLDQWPDKSRLDAALAARLPHLQEAPPGILDLAHNQSGLRDYWAVAMLHGAPAESTFGDLEAEQVIAATRTLHFRPGTAYSYVNQNFRLIAELLENETGHSFSELLRRQIFDRTGMEHAFLAANTQAMPDGTQGYEGNEANGYRAAVNNIYWTGDAGLGASLDDMIAWERAIDAQRDDPDGFYNRLSSPVTFRDGTPARYGYGLQRGRLYGRAMTGHGGALRGWRSHRLHLAAERLSVVVLFNHMSEAHTAAAELAAAALEIPPSTHRAQTGTSRFLGHFLDRETGLSATIDATSSNTRLSLRYGYPAETLEDWTQNRAGRDTTRLLLRDETVWMERPQENRTVALIPIPAAEGRHDVTGRYRCDELDSLLTVSLAGGVLYGGFSGRFGQGRMERLLPLGHDLWLVPCLRALDHAPPGYWTLVFSRDAQDRPAAVRVGCWLARNLHYMRLSD